MKKFLENESLITAECIDKTRDLDTIRHAIDVKKELDLILKELFHGCHDFSDSRSENLYCYGEGIFDYSLFIREILKVYANMPLLETETDISYPKLASTKSISNEKLTNLYIKEGFSEEEMDKLNKKINIFNPHFFTRITLNNGKCVVCNSLKGPQLVLERFYTSRDIVVPGRELIFLLVDNKDKKYPTVRLDNYTNILKYFMESRIVDNLLKETLGESERKKYWQIINDNLIVRARNLVDVSIEKSLRYQLEFIDAVIGYNMAQDPSISLSDITNDKFEKSFLPTTGAVPNLKTAKLSKQKILNRSLDLLNSYQKVN